jgi:hypothetical protein
MDSKRFAALIQEAIADPDVDLDIRRRNADPAELRAPIALLEPEVVREVTKELDAERSAEKDLAFQRDLRSAVHKGFSERVSRGIPENIVARAVAIELRRPDVQLPRRRALEIVRDSVVPDQPDRRFNEPLDLARVLPAIGLTLLVIVSAPNGNVVLSPFEFAMVAILGGIGLGGTGYLADLVTARVMQAGVARRAGNGTYGEFDLLKLDEGVTDAEVRLRERELTTDKLVKHRLVTELRSFINSLTDHSRSAVLPDVRPAGLAEVFDPRHEVGTDARAELKRHICAMPGGAIGIAGSRGAGKSTLLRSITEREPEIMVAGVNQPVLGVFTTAPVQYDGRDFILHLFAKTCSRVLGDVRTVPHATPRADAAPSLGWLSFLPLVNDVGHVSAIAVAAAGVLLFPIGVMAAFWDAAAEVLRVLDMKPAPAIGTGFVCLFGSFIVERALALLREQADAENLKHIPSAEPSIAPKPSGYAGTDESWAALVRSATDWLAEVRFQRSYSHGWSGALKLPVGVEASVNEAMTWSRRQLSLPELVKAYTEFIQQAAANFVVIIAIDELDKIGSEQKVQEFLNEVKAVFGIERCFYLLSISDHAMSSFARRGLPIRDALDSALDEVVRVPYLKGEGARDLLSKRTIRLPLPYVSFCYCLSGGLPRDVIRACRDVFDSADRIQSRNLCDLTRGVIRDDLNQKIEATITAAMQLLGNETGAAALQTLVALGTTSAEVELLLTDYSELVDVALTVESRPVRALTIDLAAYYLYAATLIEVFDDVAGPRWDVVAAEGVFDDLARLRRRLEIDTDAARRDIIQLRSKRVMHVVRPEATKVRVPQPRRYFHLSARDKETVNA